MEPQLGLYVRLGEILGLRFPTIGIRARLGPVVEAGKKAECSNGKGWRYEKGGIVAIVEGEAHGALGLRGGLLVQVKIYKAILEQNWKKVREFVNTGEIAWTDIVSFYGETSLHLAVGEFKDIEVAKDILKGIKPDLLETMVDTNGMNPAHHAALVGNTEALKIMVDYNPKCLHIRDQKDYLPIGLALRALHINTFLYLFKQTKTRKSDYDKMCEGGRGYQLLGHVIDQGLIDVAYELISDHPSMASTLYKNFDLPLKYVPIKNNSFGSTRTDTTADIENQVTTKKEYYHTLKRSGTAQNNIAEAIEVILAYSQAVQMFREIGGYIFESAITYRSEKVYKVLMHLKNFDKSNYKMFIDDDGNNYLHLAARLAHIHKLNVVSGAALQMQRELQWFEEVKKLVNPKHRQTQNKKGETPMIVFRREHEKLRKEGEEWMKKTADSYTITAALIITIVFAAAITVPGGNNGDNGKPIYERNTTFIIFAVSDAVSLFTSTTSLLLFLSILTARYADEDFLYSATLYIMFGQGKQWILIPIGALACLPIASFMTLQFPLLVELVSSTYGKGIFGKQDDHRNSGSFPAT
ncbi:ankyrin repeat family protein [Tanacetum coccineum]